MRFYDFGRFRVDTARRLLLRDQRRVNLTAKVFDLPIFLLRQRERAVSRAGLFQALWPDVVVEDGNLSVNVSVLRKALQDDTGSCYIETLPRVGYRFCGEVFEHFWGAGWPASAARASDARLDSVQKFWKPGRSRETRRKDQPGRNRSEYVARPG